MVEDEIRDATGKAGTAFGAAQMGIDAAMGGQATATFEAVAAGETTLASGAEITAAGAAGAGVAAVAGVAAAGAIGYEIGTWIDHATGASDKLSTAAVDADPALAQKSAQHWDDAGESWDKGDHLQAIGQGAEAVGDFIEGSAEAAVDKVENLASDAWDAVTDIF
jgi:hypothetical protein